MNNSDRVVTVTIPKDEETIYLASADGHVIHFKIDEINILSGVGKGVMGIKLAEGDEVALIPPVSGGAFLLSDDPLVIRCRQGPKPDGL